MSVRYLYLDYMTFLVQFFMLESKIRSLNFLSNYRDPFMIKFRVQNNWFH